MHNADNWKEYQPLADELNQLLSAKKLSKLESHNPLEKIRRNLLIGMVWATMITCAYIILIFYFSPWMVKVPLIIVSIFNIVILRSSLLLYASIKRSLSSRPNLLQQLKTHRDAIRKWWSVQEKFSIFIYPIAIIGGFIAGGTLGSGDNQLSFMKEKEVLIILGITAAIVVPLCFLGARWMYRYAYGKHLESLECTIRELET